jgi:hypothetical protein
LAFLVLFSLEQKCCLDDGTVSPAIIYNDPARQMDLAPSHLAGFFFGPSAILGIIENRIRILFLNDDISLLEPTFFPMNSSPFDCDD